MVDLSDAPERIQRLPRDSRGFPIPYAAFQPAGREPDFRVLDQERVDRCVTDRRCGVCGEPLDYWLAFIGGPACRASRTFRDPAMHPECAAFAARVCPFIAGAATLYSSRELPSDAGLVTVVDPLQADHVGRPDRMFLFRTRRYGSLKAPQGWYITAAPFVSVEEIAVRYGRPADG